MPFDALRNECDPGIHIERLAVGLVITPPRRRLGWIGVIDRAASFLAGALVGVLLAAFLIMGWRL